MPTSISDLWTPDVWIEGLDEKARTLPSLMNSGVIVRTPEMDGFASGPGETVNLPYFRDISDQQDAVQVENNAPTKQKIGSGKQIAVFCNRETANDATALAKQVSGSDPVEAIVRQLALRRLKQRQTTLVSILRAGFGGALASSSTHAFIEDGNSATSTNQGVSDYRIIDAAAKLGEIEDFDGGGILMHPNIHAALLKQDEISFKRSSEGSFKLETYKGLRVFKSNLLTRAGTTSGSVYDTYIFGFGAIGYGEKPQAADVIDAAALSFFLDKDNNNETIYDRTRFLIHPNGLRWVGTPEGQSPTNAELATAANWTLDYSSADRVNIVQLVTNL